MKGTPEAPACGFSARTVAMLQALDTPFAAVDILPDPRIRQELSAISNWPTIPQLFVDGELLGGCDIVTEMYESGELGARRCCSVPRRMAPVAVATDSTHYLPRALADARGHPPGQPVRGLAGRTRARARHGRLRRLLRAPARATPNCRRTSQPSIGDFLAVWEPLLEAGPRRRLDPPRRRHLGHLRGRPPGAGAARRARPRRSRRGDRRRNRLRRARPAGARRRRRGARRAPTRTPSSRACARRARRCGSGSASTRSSTCAAAGAIGKAQAWLGGTLKIKPILSLEYEIVPVERVRTAGRAFERMVELRAGAPRRRRRRLGRAAHPGARAGRSA